MTNRPLTEEQDAAPRRDDTMPGFEDGAQMARAADEGEQGTYVAPAPGEAQPGYIRPPSLEQFANATYLDVGPEVRAIVDKVLDFEELEDLQGIPMLTVWRRKGKPGAEWDEDGEERRLAGTEVVDPLTQWIAAQREDSQFPRYVLNLYWLHFDELRGDSAFVHHEILERHIFTALRRMEVSESGVVSNGPFTFQVAADVVKHYGLVSPGLVVLGRQLRLLPDPDE